MGDSDEQARVEAAGASAQTCGIVLEGGGMRGMYTAGVLDVLMESGVTFDDAVGVSAGAVFGCNLKSRQVGRVIRYNKRFCADKRYAGLGVWLRTGDLYSRDFAYGEVPRVLDPFDTETYGRNPMRFTVVCSDINSGRPVYHECPTGDAADIEWMRASASVPLAARPVSLGGLELLDGGICDPIPLAWMQARGHARTVVVLTRPAGYRKEPNRLMPFLRVALRRYPRFLEALAHRHELYNAELDAAARAEEAGEAFVLRPSEPISVPLMERDSDHLEAIYQLGRRDMFARLSELRDYLA